MRITPLLPARQNPESADKPAKFAQLLLSILINSPDEDMHKWRKKNLATYLAIYIQLANEGKLRPLSSNLNCPETIKPFTPPLLQKKNLGANIQLITKKDLFSSLHI
jgi:hypothetical protein